MSNAADYIIIGGGTAGLVLANRLSEDPSKTVIVLESGTDQLSNHSVNIPAFWTALIGTPLDWQYKTVPQEHLKKRIVNHPQGKLFGGSSGLNGQTLAGSSKAGIDAWEKLGYQGWNWESLLPYYKKFYTLHMPDEETAAHLGLEWVDPSFHGSDGPIQASFTGVIENPMAKAWVDTFKGLGSLTTADPFSGASTGAYSNFSAVDPITKSRSYSASQYGSQLLQRSNVRVVFNAHVQKILLSQTSPRSAHGVVAHVENCENTFTAAKEVILSAGVYNSPKILELSGVGSRSILESLGIQVLQDLPGVGENLQDHLMSGISFEVVDGVSTADPLVRQEPDALRIAQELYADGKGPLCAGGIGSHAYLPILEFTTSEGIKQRNDLFDKHAAASDSEEEFHHVVRDVIENGQDGSGAICMFHAQVNFHSQDGAFGAAKKQNFTSLGPLQSHPFSKGNTHIESADPSVKPKIDPKYLSHPLDVEFMARHLLYCNTLRNTYPLANFFKKDGERNHADAFLKTIDEAKEYLQNTCQTAYHGCGTCAMRPREKGGVVDGRLKVHGVSNLRVVDASIFPLIPRGNIMSSVYAIAEKAADIIKADA